MKRILLVYYSQSGHTEAMTQAVARGVQHEDITGIDLSMRPALVADANDVRQAQAIILGTPENFGYMSGAMKYFFDRIYYPCLDHTQGLPYAIFIRAGNDGQGALGSMERIITGLRWKRIAEPVIIKGEYRPIDLDQCTTLGLTVAAGLEAGVF